MKFRVSRGDITRRLTQLSGVAGRYKGMPILEHVLIEAKEEGLRITGSSLDMEMVIDALAEVGEQGKCTADFKKLLSICKGAPDEDIRFMLDGDYLRVKSARSSMKLATLPPSDFPIFDEGALDRQILLSHEELALLLGKTSFCAAKNDARHALNGVLFHLQHDSVRTVATNGHRLGMCDLEANGHKDMKHIIPLSAVDALKKVVSGASDHPIRFEFSASCLRARFRGLDFFTKLVDGVFPDYDRILPDGFSSDVVLDKEQALSVLSRVSMVADDSVSPRIDIDVNGGTFEVRAQNTLNESADDWMDVIASSGDAGMSINARYLIEAVRAIEGDEVRLRFNGPEKPCVIDSPAGIPNKYLVMPIRR